MTRSVFENRLNVYSDHFQKIESIVIRTCMLLLFFFFLDAGIAGTIIGVDRGTKFDDMLAQTVILTMFITNAAECSLFSIIFQENMKNRIKFVRNHAHAWFNNNVLFCTTGFVFCRTVITILFIAFLSAHFPWMGNNYPYPYSIMYLFMTCVVDVYFFFFVIRIFLFPSETI